MRVVGVNLPRLVLVSTSGGVNATGTKVTFGGSVQKRSASEAASRSADDWDWDE